VTVLESREGAPTGAALVADHMERAHRHAAHNYKPLPVVAQSAHGAWITDVTGRRYLDCLAAYSAVNFGHGHPAILAAAHRQLDAVTLVSRAFQHDQFASFCEELAALARQGHGPADEHRRRGRRERPEGRAQVGLQVKGVPAEKATIIVAGGNFHGRTITIVSFSDDADARDDYGPYTPGFRTVPYGDADAVAAAIDDTTVAVLLEPVQGEAGVIVPPCRLPARVREICDRTEHAAHRRRDPVGPRAHRRDVRVRARRRGAGHVPARQGARRRRGARVGCRRRP
jgi:ornithine--oxo-acid transaminase